jgi:HTH-type transcriptional repressor of NAD biosynthesis genes
MGESRTGNEAGLVLGKFMPPHRGHLELLAHARAAASRLTVIVVSKPSDVIPPELRVAWMRELCPDATILSLFDPDQVPEGPPNWPVWMRNIRRIYPTGPEVLISSESYGAELAARLGAKHCYLQRGRDTTRISATEIRNTPFRYWQLVPLCVRPYFALRVFVVRCRHSVEPSLGEKLAAAYGNRCEEVREREQGRRREAPGIGWDSAVLGDAVLERGALLGVDDRLVFREITCRPSTAPYPVLDGCPDHLAEFGLVLVDEPPCSRGCQDVENAHAGLWRPRGGTVRRFEVVRLGGDLESRFRVGRATVESMLAS